MPPFRLRTKSIALGTPAVASTPASCPAPDVSSTTGRLASLELGAQHVLQLAAPSATGVDAVGRLEAERREQPVAPLAVGRPRVDAQRHAGGDHVAPRRARPRPARRWRPRPRSTGRLLDPEDLARPPSPARRRGRPSASSPRGPPGPRRRSSPRITPAMPVTIPSGAPASASRGPCSMCSSRNASGSSPLGDPRPASGAAALLVTEDDDRAAAGALDRLDRGDDAERAVELPALGDGVEVRARSRPRGSPFRVGPEEIPGRSTRHLQAGLLHPHPREVVRGVLLRRVADPVRARPLADRVQPLQALHHAHAAMVREAVPPDARQPHSSARRRRAACGHQVRTPKGGRRNDPQRRDQLVRPDRRCRSQSGPRGAVPDQPDALARRPPLGARPRRPRDVGPGQRGAQLPARVALRRRRRAREARLAPRGPHRRSRPHRPERRGSKGAAAT